MSWKARGRQCPFAPFSSTVETSSPEQAAAFEAVFPAKLLTYLLGTLQKVQAVLL